MRARTMLMGVVAIAVAACGGAPQPGDMGYPYNVDGDYTASFEGDDGQTYTGTLSLTTAPGGAVTGSLAITSPVSVDGSGEGMLVGAQLDLAFEIYIPDAQCGGMVHSTSTVTEGGMSAAGDATAEYEDGCDGPTSLGFSFSK